MTTIRRALAAALLLAACGAPPPAEQAQPQAHAAGSLFGANPDERWRLPERLAEISGLAVTPDGRLLGHDDERAIVYELDVRTGRLIKNFALGDPVEQGDFEGIAVGEDGDLFMVTSTGRIYRFSEGADGENVGFDVFDSGLEQSCEVEGLAYHRTDESLILACKTVHDRNLRGRLLLYAWSTRANQPARLWIELPLTEIAGVSSLHPSGVEIDPASGRIVVIAARERALVELAADGQVLAVRRLSQGHRQAEGVAIMPDGALVIADEAGGSSRAHLALYPRAP